MGHDRKASAASEQSYPQPTAEGPALLKHQLMLRMVLPLNQHWNASVTP